MPYNIRLVSTFPPRRCGIGTFCRDLASALAQAGRPAEAIAEYQRIVERWPGQGPAEEAARQAWWLRRRIGPSRGAP